MFLGMREQLILVAHLIVTIIKVAAPGGPRSVVAESLILKHQLLILNRSRKRAPKLGVIDRVLLAPPDGADRRLPQWQTYTDSE
jgi:hypothetical protein